jgi:hypothetical protein
MCGIMSMSGHVSHHEHEGHVSHHVHLVRREGLPLAQQAVVQGVKSL